MGRLQCQSPAGSLCSSISLLASDQWNLDWPQRPELWPSPWFLWSPPSGLGGVEVSVRDMGRSTRLLSVLRDQAALPWSVLTVFLPALLSIVFMGNNHLKPYRDPLGKATKIPTDS